MLFVPADPAFAGTMLITTWFEKEGNGTMVAFIAEDVPAGIKLEDRREGMDSSLKNLAAYIEGENQ